jgi:hypothetical protein
MLFKGKKKMLCIEAPQFFYCQSLQLLPKSFHETEFKSNYAIYGCETRDFKAFSLLQSELHKNKV